MTEHGLALQRTYTRDYDALTACAASAGCLKRIWPPIIAAAQSAAGLRPLFSPAASPQVDDNWTVSAAAKKAARLSTPGPASAFAASSCVLPHVRPLIFAADGAAQREQRRRGGGLSRSRVLVGARRRRAFSSSTTGLPISESGLRCH